MPVAILNHEPIVAIALGDVRQDAVLGCSRYGDLCRHRGRRVVEYHARHHGGVYALRFDGDDHLLAFAHRHAKAMRILGRQQTPGQRHWWPYR